MPCLIVSSSESKCYVQYNYKLQSTFFSFRLAKLSEGQLIDGRLECLYHGWQFEGEGKCVKIPQVPYVAVAVVQKIKLFAFFQDLLLMSSMLVMPFIAASGKCQNPKISLCENI